MKKKTFILVLFIGLFLPEVMRSQSTLYVSNLGQTPTGSAAIGSDSWVAQTFITGTNPAGYLLNSVQLLMDAPSGTPGGFTVSLYSKTGNPHELQEPGDSPQGSLGSLTGLAPITSGIFTYTTSGIMLAPSTFYFLVATATTPVAGGAYTWSAANGLTQSNGFTIDDSYFGSSNGSSWTWCPRGDVFQFGINATTVPEPTVLELATLAMAGLIFRRRMSITHEQPKKLPVPTTPDAAGRTR